MPNRPAQGQERRDRAATAARERRAATGTAEAAKQGAVSQELVVTEAKVARALLAPMEDQLRAALPPQIPIEAFTRVILNGLQDSKSGKALMACTRPSLYKAMLDAARYGLMPFTDEATIVAFGDTATFIPQYQGFIQMFYNTGQVAAVTAQLIYKRDFWAESLGDRGGFVHKPLRFDADGNEVLRGRLDNQGNPVLTGPGSDNPPILAYCFIRFKDGSRTEVEVVSHQDAVEVRDKYSKSYRYAETSHYQKEPKRDSAWHTDFPSQWKKTAVRRAAKFAPKSSTLLELLKADNEADGLVGAASLPAPPPFVPGGPAAAWEGDVEHDRGAIAQGEVIKPDPAAGTAEPRSAAEAWEMAAPAGDPS